MPKIDVTAAKRPVPTAEWVWAEKVADNQVVYLRATVEVKGAGKPAALFVTADNYFEAYVNGEQVGATKAGNGVDNWQQVKRFDVTANLKAGKNVIALRAENAGGAAGALARLEVEGKPVLETSGNWRVSETEAPGWLDAGFDDSSWVKARSEGHADADPWGAQLHGWPGLVEFQPPYLKHLPIAPVLVSTSGAVTAITGKDKPATLQVTGPGTALVDFGKELTGRVELIGRVEVTGMGNAAEVTVGTGESEIEARTKPWTTATLTVANGKHEYSAYSAFRYALITFGKMPSGGGTVTVQCDHLYYPVAYKGSFDCSDPLLTKVWYTGAYTAHLCMQEDIWDAPKRDRLRWMGDLHVSGEVINNAFLDTFLMEQSMERLRADAQGGKPSSELPRGHVNGIPGYSCAWIAGLADFYRHSGDLAYVRSQAPLLTGMLEYLRSELDDRGVFANKNKAWCYVDWAPEFNGDTPLSRTATHLFFCHAVREAAFLFRELGDTAQAVKYEALRSQLEEAVQANMRTGNGLFGDRRQANAMAIYSGVATAEQTKRIQDEILAPDAAAWTWVATPYYNNYVLFAMKDSRQVLEVMRRIWGAMILEGATSFWEGYDPSWEKQDFHLHLQADNGTGTFVSLCHGWSAGATSYLTERVLGVQPTTGGFKTFTVRPDLGDLRWAEGKVPTPHGVVAARVDREGSEMVLKLTVPAGTMATVQGGQISVKGGPSGNGSVELKPGKYEVRIS